MKGGSRVISSNFSLTSAPEVGGWLPQHLGRFTPGIETRYPLYGRLGWPRCRCGRVRRISPCRLANLGPSSP